MRVPLDEDDNSDIPDIVTDYTEYELAEAVEQAPAAANNVDPHLAIQENNDEELDELVAEAPAQSRLWL